MKTTPVGLAGNERNLYPIHADGRVPHAGAHFNQATKLLEVLRAQRPDLWICGDRCVYREKGNTERYGAADASVAAGLPPQPDGYLVWSDAPLVLAGEMVARKTGQADLGHQFSVAEEGLRVPQYLNADPARGEACLWRRIADRYRLVPPGNRGPLRSAPLEVSLGYNAPAFLRLHRSGRATVHGPGIAAAPAGAGSQERAAARLPS